jgi:hypothetical protein
MPERWQPLGAPVRLADLHGDAKRLSELRLGLVINRTVPLMFDAATVTRAVQKLRDHPLPWEGFAE